MSELAEALRDSDDVKKQGNEWAKENKDLRERLEALEKEIRIKSLQPRSPGTPPALIDLHSVHYFLIENVCHVSYFFTGGGAGSHSHSRDSAIDSDMTEWDTEHLDIDMTEFRAGGGVVGVGNLGIDLSGGRDDVNVGDILIRPVYISSIAKGSILDGKLK